MNHLPHEDLCLRCFHYNFALDVIFPIKGTRVPCSLLLLDFMEHLGEIKIVTVGKNFYNKNEYSAINDAGILDNACLITNIYIYVARGGKV